MFQITVTGMCDDKNLPKVHWALAGLLYNANITAQPVANAKGKAGKVVDETDGSGEITDVLKKWLKKEKKTTMSAADAKTFQRLHGRSENGYSSLLRRAIDLGVLKPAKKGSGRATAYNVIGA